MIRIYCEKADAILKETQTLTSGMEVYPTVVLTFSEEWNGMGKAAVVRNGNKYVAVLVKDNKFVIPRECMEESGNELIVGISGSNGVMVIPTIWCSCGTVLEGADVNETGNLGEPTEDLVQQMLGYAEEAKEAAESAQESANTAYGDAKKWAIGKDIDDQDVPPSDATFHNNAKYYADTAAANAGYLAFSINSANGHLIYYRSDNVGEIPEDNDE